MIPWGPFFEPFFEWLLDKRSTVAGSAAIVILLITLLIYWSSGIIWQLGIALSVVCGLIAILAVGNDR